MRSPSAKAFYARALEASRAGDYRTALRMVENALEQEPDHPTLINARNRILPYTE
jgi:antitoxin component HigA of HigAB toxin-antitoxin module